MIAACLTDDCSGLDCACDCHDYERWHQENDDWREPG
jgi:hypothetical protein